MKNIFLAILLFGLAWLIFFGGFVVAAYQFTTEFDTIMAPASYAEMKESKEMCDKEAQSLGRTPCKAFGIFYSDKLPPVRDFPPEGL
jgi:hypothetical protein